MKLLFLFGSGISYESGLPSTSCLTRFLLNKNFQKMSYERFIETTSDCSNGSEIKSFLSLLKTEYKNYVKKYWLEYNKNNQCIFLDEKEKIPDYFILKTGCKTYPKGFKDTTLKDIGNILS